MDRLRWIVVLIVLGALAGGVSARFRNANSDLSGSRLEIRPTAETTGFSVAGEFVEPLGDLTGYEISLPRCSRPFGVLPVSTLSVAPNEYHYGRPGEYFVSYAFNGRVYPDDKIGLRLRLLRMFYHLQSMFGLTDARSFAYFMKIWTPSDCAGVSAEEVAQLQRSLIARVEPNPGERHSARIVWRISAQPHAAKIRSDRR